MSLQKCWRTVAFSVRDQLKACGVSLNPSPYEDSLLLRGLFRRLLCLASWLSCWKIAEVECDALKVLRRWMLGIKVVCASSVWRVSVKVENNA